MVNFAKILFIEKSFFSLKQNSFPYNRHIGKEEIHDLEPLKLTGKIRVIDSRAKIDKFRRLPSKGEIVGFDTETRPSFKKGIRHRCSLVQLAFEDEIVLFRLNKFPFPDILADILSNEESKVGIAIHDDIRQLKELRNFEERAFHDLNTIAPEVGFESIGARRLTALVLGKRLSKRQQLSNWEAADLSPAQIEYAAADAWICRKIYLEFRSKGLL